MPEFSSKKLENIRSEINAVRYVPIFSACVGSTCLSVPVVATGTNPGVSMVPCGV